MSRLLTIKEAAEALGVSTRHVQRLIQEADEDKRSQWKFGREIINLSPKTALRRTLRININAVIPTE
jgi:excisionase family DNA binding protein